MFVIRFLESLKPLLEFIHDNQLGQEFKDNFEILLQVLSKTISDKPEKLLHCISESASELQKDLKISELTSKIDDQVEKYSYLESKLFLLEKQLFALKSFKSSETSIDGSLSKKSRIDQTQNHKEVDVSGENEELLAKFNVASAELFELKKLSENRLKELESYQLKNQKLIQELESKNDQVNTTSAIFYFSFFSYVECLRSF